MAILRTLTMLALSVTLRHATPLRLERRGPANTRSVRGRASGGHHTAALRNWGRRRPTRRAVAPAPRPRTAQPRHRARRSILLLDAIAQAPSCFHCPRFYQHGMSNLDRSAMRGSNVDSRHGAHDDARRPGAGEGAGTSVPVSAAAGRGAVCFGYGDGGGGANRAGIPRIAAAADAAGAGHCPGGPGRTPICWGSDSDRHVLGSSVVMPLI